MVKVQKPALVAVLAQRAKATTVQRKSPHSPRVVVVVVLVQRPRMKTAALVSRQASLDRRSHMVAVAGRVALLAARAALAVVDLVEQVATAQRVRMALAVVVAVLEMRLALMVATVLSSSVGFLRVAAATKR